MFPAVCPTFVLEPVPFEELPSVVPEFTVPSDAAPGVLLVPELSLSSELPVPDEEPPVPVPEVPLEEPFVFPLLFPFSSFQQFSGHAKNAVNSFSARFLK